MKIIMYRDEHQSAAKGTMHRAGWPRGQMGRGIKSIRDALKAASIHKNRETNLKGVNWKTKAKKWRSESTEESKHAVAVVSRIPFTVIKINVKEAIDILITHQMTRQLVGALSWVEL